MRYLLSAFAFAAACGGHTDPQPMPDPILGGQGSEPVPEAMGASDAQAVEAAAPCKDQRLVCVILPGYADRDRGYACAPSGGHGAWRAGPASADCCAGMAKPGDRCVMYSTEEWGTVSQ